MAVGWKWSVCAGVGRGSDDSYIFGCQNVLFVVDTRARCSHRAAISNALLFTASQRQRDKSRSQGLPRGKQQHYNCLLQNREDIAAAMAVEDVVIFARTVLGHSDDTWLLSDARDKQAYLSRSPCAVV